MDELLKQLSELYAQRDLLNADMATKRQEINETSGNKRNVRKYLRQSRHIRCLYPQVILGHNSLKTVEHYLALVRADLKTAHRRASPVDNWRL